jgi:hypothetical protein
VASHNCLPLERAGLHFWTLLNYSGCVCLVVRPDVPEVKHIPAFSAEISIMAMLEALGDAPRAYTMGQGGNAGHSHRKVAWLGDDIDTPYATQLSRSSTQQARFPLPYSFHHRMTNSDLLTATTRN